MCAITQITPFVMVSVMTKVNMDKTRQDYAQDYDEVSVSGPKCFEWHICQVCPSTLYVPVNDLGFDL